MRTDQRVELLRAVPMFSACSGKELREISRTVDVLDVEPGRVLLRQGQRGSEFFVVASGEVEVGRDGAVVDKIGAGGFFGELSLLDPGPCNATVTVVTPGQVLVLGQRSFFPLLAEVPELARKLLTGMARRLHEADARAVR